MGTSRTRNYTFILYPEEICEDYVSKLESLNVPFCISPLHDPDPCNVDPSEQRKKHNHVFFAFDGVKTQQQVVDMLEDLFGSHIGWALPIKVNSTKGLVRYFIHADQPDKQQFDKRFNEILCFNGFVLDDFIIPSSSEKSMYICEMQCYCDDHKICEITDLYKVARDYHYDTWFYMLNTSCFNIMNGYVRSIRHRIEKIESLKNFANVNSKK